MNINIDMSKRGFVLIVITIVFLVAIGFAFSSVDPSIHGHPIGEITGMATLAEDIATNLSVILGDMGSGSAEFQWCICYVYDKYENRVVNSESISFKVKKGMNCLVACREGLSSEGYDDGVACTSDDDGWQGCMNY